MNEAARSSVISEWRVRGLEERVRKSAGLHGLYAAAGLLVGLFLPVARILPSNSEVPEGYNPLGLVFSINREYELDHPIWVAVAGLLITLTVVTAVIAFLVAARRLDEVAARVALVACALLPPILVIANLVFTVTEAASGSGSEPLQGWTSGFWVLFLGAVVCCGIAAFLRDQLDR